MTELPAGSTTASAPMTAAPDNNRPFKAGATLLILANIACGVFAFLAGKEIGNKHVDFAIAFTMLGVVFLGIFALAAVDSRTRQDPDDWEYHH